MVIGLLLLTVFLRFYGLGQPSLWSDEGVTVHQSQKSPGALLAGLHKDVHPPLYYLSAHLWSGVFGPSEAGLRSLSAVATCLTVWLAFLFYRQASQRLAVIVTTLMTFSLFQINLALEARSHALGALWTMAAVACLWHWLEEEDHPLWGLGGWLITTFLSLYTNFFGYLMVITANLFVWAQTRYKGLWLRWALAQVSLALLALPFLILMRNSLERQADSQGYFTATVPGPTALARLFHEMVIYHNYPSSGLALAETTWVTWLIAALSLGLACLGWTWFENRRLAWLVGLWLFVPLSLTVILPLISNLDVFVLKYFLPCLPALLGLMGAGLLRLQDFSGGRPLSLGLLGLLISINLVGWTYRKFHPDHSNNQDWRRIGKVLTDYSREGDVIVVQPGMAAFALSYYYDGKCRVFTVDQPGGLAIIEKPLGKASRIWLVTIPIYPVVVTTPLSPLFDRNFERQKTVRSSSFYDANVVEISVYKQKETSPSIDD